MAPVLHLISDVMPMSYAVDAMRQLSRYPEATAALWGDLAVVLAFAGLAVGLGAATLRRRTD
jgi:ABC-2 type transport system permease protein